MAHEVTKRRRRLTKLEAQWCDIALANIERLRAAINVTPAPPTRGDL